MRPRLAGLAVTLALAALLAPAAARADVTITPTCTTPAGTGACSDGWYTTNVTVSFSLSGSGFSVSQGCGSYPVTTDTADFPASCIVDVGGGNLVGRTVHVKRDATPPTATGISAERGPDTNGWYNHPLRVAVSGSDQLSGIASCTAVTYSGPDSSSASVTGSCTDNAGNVSASQTLTFKYDGTAPSISANPSRGPDSNGWYNHPVDVAFAGGDATSGLDSCTSASYSGPDSGGATVSGTCRDQAGNVATASLGLKYDATAPTVTAAAADRPPDANGWYNHRVLVTFAGSDDTSSIAGCDTPSYDGPDNAQVTVSGRCRDNAGNASGPGTFSFKFDSTPPKLTDIAAGALDRGVSLKWKTSADVEHLTVVRTAGAGGASTTVYDGKPTEALTDKDLQNGVRYTYTVTAVDDAGNAVVTKTAAEPSAPLIAPRQEAHVHGVVVLRWRAVPKASYYNVQLWLRGAKILTTWPRGTSLRVPRRWTFAGRTYVLRPARYVWYVWPGFGPRTKHRFGRLVGTSSFVVSR
jgi:hypothetical protein